MCQRLFHFIALVLLFPTGTRLNAAPQLQGGFSQINMQDGGYYPAIIQHPSGRLVGRTDGGGIYSSDNHGYSWTYLSGNMTTTAALVPQGIAMPQTAGSSSNLILQACGVSYLNTDPGRGIWKSTNGGTTWTQTLSGVNFSGGDQERVGGECLIFNPTNGSEVWAGSRGQGLFESTNAGDSGSPLSPAWKRTSSPRSIFLLPLPTSSSSEATAACGCRQTMPPTGCNFSPSSSSSALRAERMERSISAASTTGCRSSKKSPPPTGTIPPIASSPTSIPPTRAALATTATRSCASPFCGTAIWWRAISTAIPASVPTKGQASRRCPTPMSPAPSCRNGPQVTPSGDPIRSSKM